MKSWLVAHRGVTINAKENTAPALKQAKKFDLGYVEFDVRVTKDGAAILHHDPEINDLQIDKTNFVDLKKQDKKLITLKEAFKILKNKNVIIDLKADGSYGYIADYLIANPKSYVTSFILPEVLATKLCGVKQGQTFIAQHIHGFGLINKALKNRVGGISINKFSINPYNYHQATKYGLNIMIYTVNSTWLAKLYRKMYPKALICTDRPDKLQLLN